MQDKIGREIEPNDLIVYVDYKIHVLGVVKDVKEDRVVVSTIHNCKKKMYDLIKRRKFSFYKMNVIIHANRNGYDNSANIMVLIKDFVNIEEHNKKLKEEKNEG